MEKIRYKEPDLARGMGIILVVLGHSIKQTQVSAEWIKILTFLIYSFHMPLFFALSGFVAVKVLYMEDFKDRLNYIKDRAVRLLVPYAVVTLIYIPVKLKLSAYAVEPFTTRDLAGILIGDSPCVSMWFLYVLFVVSTICALFVSMSNFRSILYGSFALSAALYWANLNIRTGKYLFFFLLGIWIRLKFEDARKEGIEDVLSGQSILAFFAVIIFVGLEVLLYRTTITGTMVGTSLLGIYLALWSAGCLLRHYRQSPATKLLDFLGMHSMEIYILHEPVMTVLKLVLWNKLGLNYILCSVLIFIGAIILSIAVSVLIVRRFGITRLLLLGEKT